MRRECEVQTVEDPARNISTRHDIPRLDWVVVLTRGRISRSVHEQGKWGLAGGHRDVPYRMLDEPRVAWATLVVDVNLDARNPKQPGVVSFSSNSAIRGTMTDIATSISAGCLC